MDQLQNCEWIEPTNSAPGFQVAPFFDIRMNILGAAAAPACRYECVNIPQKQTPHKNNWSKRQLIPWKGRDACTGYDMFGAFVSSSLWPC